MNKTKIALIEFYPRPDLPHGEGDIQNISPLWETGKWVIWKKMKVFRY